MEGCRVGECQQPSGQDLGSRPPCSPQSCHARSQRVLALSAAAHCCGRHPERHSRSCVQCARRLRLPPSRGPRTVALSAAAHRCGRPAECHASSSVECGLR
eukprot:3427205-Prymnesium_polylepis.1